MFNALLEDMARQVKDKWKQKRYGIQLTDTGIDHRTNLRFADDVLLFANTLPQIQTMIADLQEVSKASGLLLHPDKTKILANATHKTGRPRRTHVDIYGMKVEVLDLTESTKYLGRLIGFERPHDDELENRIRQAWKTFMSNKHELTGKRYTLRNRLRLFDGVVTPSMLYGSACWCLTKDLQTKMKRTQWKMLRMVLGSGRRRARQPAHAADSSATTDSSSNAESSIVDDSLVPWQDWIRRTTREAEAQLNKYDLTDWTVAWRRKVWQWAGRAARFDKTRWAWRALIWQPSTSLRAKGRRPAGLRKRWSDDIVHFLKAKGLETCHANWFQCAVGADQWQAWEEEFCTRSE